MIFSGLEMMGEIPFRDVIIHTTVLAAGRAPDVEEPRYRARSARAGRRARRRRDPLRLLKMSSSQDVRFAIGAIEEGRKLANKLWNASRLVLGAGPTRARSRPRRQSRNAGSSPASTRPVPRSTPISTPSTSRTPSTVLYHLTFDDFCDWYLGGDQAAPRR